MKRQLLVCMQLRYAPNPKCCGTGGNKELISQLHEVIKLHSLDVDVIPTSCMLMCIHGPNMQLMPEGTVWNHSSSETVQQIVTFLQDNP